MFFAFLGFESISMAADETKEPQKKIPQGIISIGLVTLLYVAVTLILTGTVHYSKLNITDVVPYVLRSIGFPFIGNFCINCCYHDTCYRLHFHDVRFNTYDL